MPVTFSQEEQVKAAAASERGTSQSQTQKVFALGLLLIAISLTLYKPVINHPFVNYDDHSYVVDNTHVKDGFSWAGLTWAFTTYDESNWHPLTWFSHMLDYRLFGLNPAGHHAVNAALHAVNVALLFWVLYGATGFIWRNFMVAALFGLHPINVESVAWIAERKNLLSQFFFLLALGAYGWYARQPSRKRYAVVAVLFAFALMSKAQAITLPFVLLLWDYWPLCRVNSLDECVAPANALYAKRSWRQLASEKLPFFAMCVPSAILTLRAQSAAGAVTAFTRYPLPIRVANATVSYARYLGKAVSPSHLSLMYPYQPQSLTNWQILLAVLLLVSITCAVFSGGKRYLTVGWLWFLGTLVPMIGLVQVGVQSMADRYAYLPFIGLFIAVCWGAADLAGDRPSARELLIWCSCLLLTALAFGSHRQIGYWSSDLNLWSHAVAVTDENFIAEDGMGNSLLEQGELEEAVPHFQKAVAIRPTDPISNANLAFYKMRNGDLTGALAQYRIALSNTRNEILRANAFTNIGSIENQLGNISAARDDYAQAVILRPRNALAWTGLGVVNQKIGDYDAAVRAFSRAVALQPSDVTYLLLAAALQKDGKSPEAESATRTAIHLSQNIEEAHRFVNGMLGP